MGRPPVGPMTRIRLTEAQYAALDAIVAREKSQRIPTGRPRLVRRAVDLLIATEHEHAAPTTDPEG